MTCSLFMIGVVPLQFLTTLQRLDLVGSGSMTPKMRSKPYMHILFPRPPCAWKQMSWPGMIGYILTSPVAGLVISAATGTLIDRKLTVYSNAIIPRPDNPDTVSFKTDNIDGDYVNIPVQSLPPIQRTLDDEIGHDLNSIKLKLQEFNGELYRYFAGIVWKISELTAVWKLNPPTDPQARSPTSEVAVYDGSPAGTGSTTIVPWQAPSHDQQRQNAYGRVEETMTTQAESTTPPASPAEHAVSTSGSRRSSGTIASSELESRSVQIQARRGSSSTLHMDLEVNATVHQGGPPTYTSSLAASHRPLGPRDYPLHRVTALTIHPSQSLGLQLSSMVNTIIRLPLVAAYQRSVARAYLSAQDNPEQNWLSNEMYPVFGPSPSMYGWKGVGAYWAKLAICIAMETVTGMVIWRTSSIVAWALGTKHYSWGKL
jgi:hypothetical protein